MNKCRVCGSPAIAKGLCRSCYKRAKYYGLDPLTCDVPMSKEQKRDKMMHELKPQSERERNIVNAIIAGFSYAHIGCILNISQQRVSYIVRRMHKRYLEQEENK